jgi:hypothetical protein
MGQGAKAGLPIYKDLRTHPKPLSEIESEVDIDAVPAVSEPLRSRAADRARSDD